MSNVLQLKADEKVCALCGFAKPVSEFNKDKTRKDGMHRECRECCKSRNKTRRANSFKSPEARKEYLDKKKKYNRSVGYYDNYFRKKFGITYEEVKSMFDAQFGRCANRACSKEIVFYHDNEHGRAHPNRACLDHDHASGKVRALLCMSCNTVLGTLESKENVVLGLLEYGFKHGASKNSRLFTLTEKWSKNNGY